MVITIGISGSNGFIGGEVFRTLTRDRNFKVKKILRSDGTLLCNEHFDVIIHCGEVSDRKTVNDLGENYRYQAINNVTHLVSKCQYLIYLSSSVLYDSSNCQPKDEMSEIIIADNYCKTKTNVEKIVLSNGGIAVRISNVYGEGMSSGNVLSDILSQIGLKTMKLNNVYAVRDFIHVQDVARYISELALSRTNAGIINIGSGVGLSINDIAEFVNRTYGLNVTKITSKASPNLNSIILNIDKLHKICSYRPVNSIQSFLINKIVEH